MYTVKNFIVVIYCVLMCSCEHHFDNRIGRHQLKVTSISSFEDQNGFKDGMCRYIATWADENDGGSVEFRDSCGKFNVGDHLSVIKSGNGE